LELRDFTSIDLNIIYLPQGNHTRQGKK